MRVLVLHSELGVLRGGGENVTRNLLPAFARRGHRVSAAFVADWRGKYPLSLPREIEPIPLRGWWSSTLGQSTLSLIGRYIPWKSQLRTTWDRVQESLAWRTFRWHCARFRRRVEREFAGRWDDFDALYVHSDTILASTVARYRPTVLFLAGPVTAERGPMLRAVHAVCTNGDALVRIRTFLGDHAIDLPLGLDIKAFTPDGISVRSKLGWGDHHRVVGYVGRLTHLKGADLLAAAFREVAKEAPHARLLIVGTGEEEIHLRSVLALEFAAGLVHLEAGVDHEQLPAWYRAMDLIVMPSRYENHSNVLLEAIACGVPFLASDVGGNRVLSQMTGAGWLFEPGSVPSLTHALCHGIENSRESKARGEAGVRCVQNHNTWAATAESLEQIFMRISSAARHTVEPAASLSRAET